jgi:parallel beta-helix repeat protein
MISHALAQLLPHAQVMKRTTFLSLLVCALVICFASLCMALQIYYVAPAGNNSNPGTIDRPWRTIQRAADVMTPGSTVYIRGGTYPARVIAKKSGTDDQHYIAFAAYPGEVVIIDGSNVPVPTDEGLFYVAGKKYIKIIGLRIVYSKYAGILVENSSYITIQNNKTTKTASSGIGVWACDHIMIANNEVSYACSNGMQESISVAQTAVFEVKNNVVRDVDHPSKEGICIKQGSADGKVFHNHVFRITAPGIYLDAWDQLTARIAVFGNRVHDIQNDAIALACEMGGTLQAIRIYDNLIYNSLNNGINVSKNGTATHHPMKQITIINNTVYHNGGQEWGGAILIDTPDAREVVVRNNVCSRNFTYQIAVFKGVPSANYTVDHNLIDGYRAYDDPDVREIKGAVSFQANPLFVAPDLADFHLQAKSRAIDKASPLSAPLTDFDGVVRPQEGDGDGVPEFDIGAFEYIAH